MLVLSKSKYSLLGKYNSRAVVAVVNVGRVVVTAVVANGAVVIVERAVVVGCIVVATNTKNYG